VKLVVGLLVVDLLVVDLLVVVFVVLVVNNKVNHSDDKVLYLFGLFVCDGFRLFSPRTTMATPIPNIKRQIYCFPLI